MIDPLIDYPGYLLRRASSTAMSALGKRLKKLDLRPSEATVLNVIETNPNTTQGDIGRLLDIASANLAPLVSRLEERDLIERRPVDGRSHGLSLSPKGRALAVRVNEVIAEHEEALLNKIPASQRSAFLAGLRALVAGDPD